MQGARRGRTAGQTGGGVPVPARVALDANALEDLRWYLDDYLQAPYGVWEERGPTIRVRLADWGNLVFESVFGGGAGP